MSAPRWLDTRLIIWLLTVGAAGVMAYARLETLGDSVARVQTTIEEQAGALDDHIIDPGSHTTRGLRVTSLEAEQTKLEARVERMDERQQKIDRNMVAICTSLGADCER